MGGGIPVHDEVVLQLQRMNSIISFDETYGIVKSEAGVVLQTLQEYVAERGHLVPIDLAAKGSCLIGGNLATNAGGIKLLKYNSMHANTLGLRVVLADGTVLDDMKALRKDNTGYDLRQLFIGSEGTLGVITECALLYPVRPGAMKVALFGCSRFEGVLQMLRLAKAECGEALSAFEYMDRECMGLYRDYIDKDAKPLGEGDGHEGLFPFYVVVEVSVQREAEAEDVLLRLAEAADGVAQEGVI